MLGILPTLPYLYIQYPDIFPNTNCIICKNHKGHTHWLTCPGLPDLKLTIKDTIQEFFHSSRLDIMTSQLHDLHNKLSNLYCLSLNQQQSNNINIFTTIKGYIPLLLIQTIQEYTDSHKAAITITIKFLLQFTQNIYNYH